MGVRERRLFYIWDRVGMSGFIVGIEWVCIVCSV